MTDNISGYTGRVRHNYGTPTYPEAHEDKQFERPIARGTITTIDWRTMGHKAEEDEEMKRPFWTTEEELEVKRLKGQGLTWSQMAKQMAGNRSAKALEVHYNTCLRHSSAPSPAEVAATAEPESPMDTLAGAILQSVAEAEQVEAEAIVVTDPALHAKAMREIGLEPVGSELTVKAILENAERVSTVADTYHDWIQSTLEVFGELLGAAVVTSAPPLSSLLAREG